MKLLRCLLVAIVLFGVITSVALAQNDESTNAIVNDNDNNNNNNNDVAPRQLKRSRKGGKINVAADDTDDVNNTDEEENNVVPVPGRKAGRKIQPGENETKRMGGAAAGKSKRITTDKTGDADVDFNDIIDNDKYVHFFSAFVASFSVIIVSEIGDKTFFIAAVMAMRHPRLEVFASAIAALALMTVLSAAAGNILPTLLSPVWTHYASMVLFFFFGFKLLKQGYETDPVPKKNEELEEVEEELERSEHEEANPTTLEGGAGASKQKSFGQRTHLFFRRFFSPVFIQGFTMTFLAEWGDRSQIATIALAAARDPVGVTLGGILGHAICTGGAVISGKFAAARISERTVSFFGGACFLLCGLYSLYSGPDTIAPVA